MSDASKPTESNPVEYPSVSEKLFPHVYEDLRALARRKMSREPANHTLQPTALVHECFIRMAKNPNQQWENRGHFYAAAAEAMRRLLIDRARRKRAEKRGGDQEMVDLDRIEIASPFPTEDIEAVSAAIDELEEAHQRVGTVVKLRFFIGLSKQEIADSIGVSPRTVDTDWAFARAWLCRRLQEDIF